jgi:hypothetical protein
VGGGSCKTKIKDAAKYHAAAAVLHSQLLCTTAKHQGCMHAIAAVLHAYLLVHVSITTGWHQRRWCEAGLIDPLRTCWYTIASHLAAQWPVLVCHPACYVDICVRAKSAAILPVFVVFAINAGTRSIQMLYRAVLFTFAPTFIELIFVVGLLANRFSPMVAVLVGCTFALYVAWTLSMTQVSTAGAAGVLTERCCNPPCTDKKLQLSL